MNTKLYSLYVLVLMIGSAFLFQNCQDNEIIGTEELDTNLIEISSKGKPTKLTVCHFNSKKGTYKVIKINQKDLNKHLGHKDIQLIDADKDGFYANESNCINEVDCDDTNPDIYPGSVETCDEGTFIDVRDGNEYKWVKIGNQIWMAENLSHFANREGVAEIWSPQEEDSEYNTETYGVYYNWAAATEVCPDGWHLPTYEEWEELASFISTEQGHYKVEDTWYNVGRHLKATILWIPLYGTDDYGFSALPGNGQIFLGEDGTFGHSGYFWTASENTSETAWVKAMLGIDWELYTTEYDKSFFTTIRCVKD